MRKIRIKSHEQICQYCSAIFLSYKSISRFCSPRCNNQYYRTQNHEYQVDRIREWRSKNKKQIIAVCICCNKEFNSTRSSSKYCSTDCYNDVRRKMRKTQEFKDKDHILSKERYYRMRQDPIRRLRVDLRCRINIAIRGNFKSGSAVKDLGCSIEELKTYLESKFQSNMTWDNWSRTGWHIDHIRPLSSFDLSDPVQVKLACHYTNLQPLWAKDNLKKGAKL